MQHPDEGTIHAWLDGALSADEAATVEAHVNGCAQCQAAVAEARGFIAASSRILTALDNVPSGVVPVAKPKRRVDPMMWRIAATVLVVAAGTLVVVRNSGVDTRSNAESATLTSGTVQADSAASKALETAATAAPSVAAPQAQVAATTEKKAATDRPRATRSGGAGVVGRVASPDSRADLAGTRNTAPVRPSPVPAATPPSRFQAMEGQANKLAMDAAAPEPTIRVVGTPRAIGQKITLYEVAPGDTVRLTEPSAVSLDAAVVTGRGETVQQAAQPKAAIGAAAPTVAAPTAKIAAPTDTNRPAPEGEVAGAGRRGQILLRGPATYGGLPAGTITITWRDSTGRSISLSGRHTPAELEAIRQRIEQFRASSTPAAPCPSSDSLCRRR